MGTRVRQYLTQGYTPQQVIAMGYKKSTVYKVNESVKSYQTTITKPDWLVNFTPSVLRSLPNTNLSINVSFENTSGSDLYLTRVGLLTDWMQQGTWVAQDVKDLVKPGYRRNFSFVLGIPQIDLGEYELRFGIEGQYLPVRDYSYPPTTQWSEPIVFHVKYPPSGLKIFFCHSVKDLSRIRELEKKLDYQGIEIKIAEDIPKPGSELNQKFQQIIRESTIFLALLTENSVVSKWVLMEIDYAIKIRKPMIILKEKELQLNPEFTYEWVEFSRYESSDTTFHNIMGAIDALRNNGVISNPIGSILGVGLLITLLGFIFKDTS
jgi:hypothetical protein